MLMRQTIKQWDSYLLYLSSSTIQWLQTSWWGKQSSNKIVICSAFLLACKPHHSKHQNQHPLLCLLCWASNYSNYSNYSELKFKIFCQAETTFMWCQLHSLWLLLAFVWAWNCTVLFDCPAVWSFELLQNELFNPGCSHVERVQHKCSPLQLLTYCP